MPIVIVIKKMKFLLLFGSTLCIIAACGGKGISNTQDSRLEGEIYYLERMALPANAVITVSLEDVSLADAPAKVLAQEIINPQGKQVPFSFTLNYDPRMVKPNHSYSIRASIRVGEQLWFTTTKYNGVKLDSSDQQPLRIRVERVTR